MVLLVAFFVVHIVMILAAGPINELRSIITGWYRTDPPAEDAGNRTECMTMQKFQINRRSFLTAAALGGSGLALSGCDVFDGLGHRDNGLRNFFESANDLTYRVQRLLGGGHTLAQEFTEADIRQPQRPNGVTAPDDAFYKGLLSKDFADWRLEVAGLVEKPLSLTPRPADRHAEPHPDHPARLRRGLELHRQMDRHAAVAGARRGQGEAGGPLRRLPLPGFDRDDRLSGDVKYYGSIDLDRRAPSRRPSSPMA